MSIHPTYQNSYSMPKNTGDVPSDNIPSSLSASGLPQRPVDVWIVALPLLSYEGRAR